MKTLPDNPIKILADSPINIPIDNFLQMLTVTVTVTVTHTPRQFKIITLEISTDNSIIIQLITP